MEQSEIDPSDENASNKRKLSGAWSFMSAPSPSQIHSGRRAKAFDIPKKSFDHLIVLDFEWWVSYISLVGKWEDRYFFCFYTSNFETFDAVKSIFQCNDNRTCDNKQFGPPEIIEFPSVLLSGD